MGTIFCHHHQPTVGQIKPPVQCVENPKGSGGLIINDRETFAMNKQHLISSVVMASEDNKDKCLLRP